MPKNTPRYVKENILRRHRRQSEKKKEPPVIAQSGVIPYRVGAAGIELLLVTSRNGRRWIFPKGIVETGLHPRDSAAKEAWEEAGVLGAVTEEALGSYSFEKWGGICHVDMYALLVQGVAEEYDERAIRQRRWVSLDEARASIAERGLLDLLEVFAEQIRELHHE
ncbi:MAG: NUDIX hydrolase [Ignavibacteriae bacterium]|nr:NUDIX hydrolase [Ignavibacteriota bacterium]